MDWVGYFLFAACLTCLIMGLSWAENPCKCSVFSNSRTGANYINRTLTIYRPQYHLGPGIILIFKPSMTYADPWVSGHVLAPVCLSGVSAVLLVLQQWKFKKHDALFDRLIFA